MPTHPPLHSCEFQDAVPGSLLSFLVNDGNVITMVHGLRLPEDSHSPVALFRGLPAQKHEPHLLDIAPDIACLNYGSAWVFELLPVGLITQESHLFDDSPGLAVVSDNSTALRFGREPQNVRSHAAYWDLANITAIPRLAATAFATRSWKLWISDEERRRPGAIPLCSHPV